MITVCLSADRWLWTAEVGDRATGHVCNDRPLRAARYEGSGLNMIAVHEVDLPAGTLLVSTPAGMSSRGAGPCPFLFFSFPKRSRTRSIA